MRLTLRTLLAYMDGILEPDDAQDIGKKIEQSELASNLLHRTSNVVRRLRLRPPSLTDQEPGLDANTVAEYLDNTLHDDRVPDFERVCLDSDAHLAEVASCHQVLTLVLGEPAEIDAAMRQRMYHMPETSPQSADSPAEGPPVQSPPVAAPPVAGESVVAQPAGSRQKPAVPDYLRDSRKRRRLLPIAASLAVIVSLAAVTLYGIGQFEPGTPLGDLLGVQAKDAEVAQGSNKETSPAKPAEGTDDEPSPESDPPTDDEANEPTVGEPGELIAPTAPVEPSPPAGVADNGAAPGDAPLPAEDAPIPPEHVPPTDRDGPAPHGPFSVDKVPENPVPDPLEDPPVDNSPRSMGQLMSVDQVLLQSAAGETSWKRVASDGHVFPNGRLIALPTYRAKISLIAGVNLQLLGETEIELLPVAPPQPVGLDVRFGRVTIKPLADAGTQVRLSFGDRTGIITFADADSKVVVQVVPLQVPGEDPETARRTMAVDLYVLSDAQPGRIFWHEEGMQEPLRIESGNHLLLNRPGSYPVVAVENLPKWIAADTSGYLDQQAASVMHKTLRLDQSAGLGLMEILADDRRKEVRWLAEQCLATIGEYDSMVASLNKVEKKLDWPEYIEALQQSVWRSQESARAVRLNLQSRYAQDASILYRLLWGYTLEQLQGAEPGEGEAGKLIGYLDHETLAIRVVSFWNLKRIAGFGLLYRPELTAAKRKLSIREWQKRLASGEVLTKLAAEAKQGEPITQPVATPEAPEPPL